MFDEESISRSIGRDGCLTVFDEESITRSISSVVTEYMFCCSYYVCSCTFLTYTFYTISITSIGIK